MFWVEVNCCRVSNAACFFDITFIVPIVIEGRGEVEADYAMACVCSSAIGVFMYDDFAAGWCQ